MSHLFCKSLVPDMFRINGLMENREREKTATRKDGKAMRKIRFMLRHQDMVDMVVPASGFLNMSEGCQG